MKAIKLSLPNIKQMSITCPIRYMYVQHMSSIILYYQILFPDIIKGHFLWFM